MLILTLRGITEQKWFQTFMSYMRFTLILTVVLVCVASLASGKALDSDKSITADIPPAIGDFSYLFLSMPIVLTALMFQSSIPTIVDNLNRPRDHIKKIMIGSCLTACSLYWMIGAICPLVT